MYCLLQEALHDYLIPRMGPAPPLGSLAILVLSLEEFMGNYCNLACLNPYEILAQVTALGPSSSLFLSGLLPHSLSPWAGMALGLWLTLQNTFTLSGPVCGSPSFARHFRKANKWDAEVGPPGASERARRRGSPTPS